MLCRIYFLIPNVEVFWHIGLCKILKKKKKKRHHPQYNIYTEAILRPLKKKKEEKRKEINPQ